MKREITRRQFIKTSAVSMAVAGTVVAGGETISEAADTALPNPYPVMLDKKPIIPSPEKLPLFFNDHQYKLVAALSALIVPTDNSHGAIEAGVADYIDKMIAGNEKRQKQYTAGLLWIDDVSLKQYDQDFLNLNVTEQIELLIAIDEAEAKVYRYVYTILERVDRKMDEIWTNLFGIGLSSNFFRRIRKDVFYGYYSNPVSWKTVGYYGPPQPIGYPDYAKPPSTEKYISTIRPIHNSTCQNCHSDQLVKPEHQDQTSCMDCHEPHFPVTRDHQL